MISRKKKEVTISLTAPFPTTIISNAKDVCCTAQSLYLAEVSAWTHSKRCSTLVQLAKSWADPSQKLRTLKNIVTFHKGKLHTQNCSYFSFN